MYNKVFKFLALITLCLSLSINILAQRNKGVDPVNLTVSIDDLVSQNLYGIGSDGIGSYVHGENLVEAQFLSSGVLSFKSGNRFVNAYYSNSFGSNSLGDSLTTQTLPSSDSNFNVKFITFVGSKYLQTMAVNESRCEGLVVSFPLGDYTRQIGYRAGRGDLTTTGYVKVTHPDINTWIMESNSGGSCSSNDSIARVRMAKTSGKTAPDIDYGRYNMPFRLVLTRKLP
ncbi:MAG TPA: hypothetical protein VF556_14420 [Pyrinomonadaceae bacterium]|jgi:hypothetical protein